MSVWFFVAWGELFAGILLFVGGLTIALKDGVGDVLTRFSGIVICGIMTGVILIGEPESITYVLLYEHFHLMLYCGGLFFALRGNSEKFLLFFVFSFQPFNSIYSVDRSFKSSKPTGK